MHGHLLAIRIEGMRPAARPQPLVAATKRHWPRNLQRDARGIRHTVIERKCESGRRGRQTEGSHR